ILYAHIRQERAQEPGPTRVVARSRGRNGSRSHTAVRRCKGRASGEDGQCGSNGTKHTRSTVPTHYRSSGWRISRVVVMTEGARVVRVLSAGAARQAITDLAASFGSAHH